MVQRSVLLLLLSSAFRPPHPLTPSMPPQRLFLLLSSALGLEQLRNLRHLDVAYNLLEGHTELSPLWLLAELRKVRHECLKGLGATFRSGSPCAFTSGGSLAYSPSSSTLQLYLEGNPLWFHPAHRANTAQYLSPRARDAAHGVSAYLVSILLRLYPLTIRE